MKFASVSLKRALRLRQWVSRSWPTFTMTRQLSQKVETGSPRMKAA